MIPLRVRLHNFLCHADQEFVFDGHPVWLLHGPNGVGKSAVFDAMLYALFGVTKRNDTRDNAVADVIRHGETSARVEFEFEHESRRYRVWRIRPRIGQPKQGADTLTGDTWTPVANAAGKEDLKQWVHKTLGLTYETFVSAILLRQGAAEKLIDANKDERREVLRSFIDLDDYLQLQERVKRARADLTSAVRHYRAQMDGMPAVTALELVAANTAVTETAERHAAAKTAEDHLREFLGHARSWQAHEAERQQLKQQLDAAGQRKDRAEELRQQVERLAELRLIVPALRQALTLREQLKAAEDASRLRSAEKQEVDRRRDDLRSSLEETQTKAESLQEEFGRLDKEKTILDREHKEFKREIERAEHAAGLIETLEKLRAKTFPADLDDRHVRAQEAVYEAQAARDAQPYLEGLVKHRADYQLATGDENAAQARLDTATQELQQLREAEAAAKTKAQAAQDQSTKAQNALAIAGNQLEKAIERKGCFAKASSKPVCSECGQTINEEHARKERARLDQAVREATEHHESCQRAATEVAAQATAAQRRHGELEQAAQKTDKAVTAATRDRDEAHRRATTARIVFDEARGRLDRHFAERVADIMAEGYPTAADAEAIRKTAGQLAARTKQRDNLATSIQDRIQTRDAILMQEQSLAAVGAPPDLTAAKAHQAELDLKLHGLNEQLLKTKSVLTEARNTAHRLTQQGAELNERLSILTGAIAKAEEQASGLRQRWQEAVSAVPESHRAAAWDVTKGEVDCLAAEQRQIEATNVEQERAALERDVNCFDMWKERFAEVMALIAQVPEPARRPATELEREIQRADQATKAAAKLHQDALNRLHSLQHQRDVREKLDCACVDAEHQHALHDKLVELLGEKGLQLALVRDAEHRIIKQANNILNRLSNGELRFEPPDPKGDKPFEIYIRLRGCPEPIAVGNLSGGQRFRVAVALALAVCQGPGDVARPLETVIIDEGFGTLDRDGRAAMIAELRDGQALGQLFKKVIVVSHQDDFASAFPVGYKLSAENGATRVETFGLTSAAP
jgi:DNA repair exonuclease SbcCD ATPase subunit